MIMLIMCFLILCVLICLGCIAWLIKRRKMTIPFLYRKQSGQFFFIGTMITDNPLLVNMKDVSPLDKSSLSLPSPLQMMADPFVIRYEGEYYIFYEELTQKKYAKGADIAVLQSKDGKQWYRLGVALREPFHLSFPNVFQYKGEWYMLPEAGRSHELRLYRAKQFPLKWELSSILPMTTSYVDPCIYVDENTLWLWLCDCVDGNKLRLYYTKNMQDWTEHPSSPIRENWNDTWPAGTIACLNTDEEKKIFFFTQDSSEGYGTGVWIYQIDELTETTYSDHKLHQPLIWKNGDGWARDGMHQYSFCTMPDGRYLCVMDGCKNIEQGEWKWDWRNWPILYK